MNRGRVPRVLRSPVALAAALVREWWSQVAALAAAAAVVATTISGALGVGASLTRGLSGLALERLGAIEAAVVGDEPFTAALAERLAAALAADSSTGRPERLLPALILQVSLEAAGPGTGPRAASRATLLACDDLTALGFAGAAVPPGRDGVLVNAPLAAALAASAGDAVVLRIPRRGSVPADTPLGRRTAESAGRRLSVAAVLPEGGLGRFSLRPTQVTGPLAVTSLATARAIIRRDDAVNAILATGVPARRSQDHAAGAASWLERALEPRLADYGLALESAAGLSPTVRLVGRRLVLPPEVDRAAREVLGPLGGTPSLVFLATEISIGEPTGDGPLRPAVPYSTVAGIAATSLPVGDLVGEDGRVLPPPDDDGVVIDRWVADDLAAAGAAPAVGDEIALRIFLPETLDGKVEETTQRLRLAGIAEMRGMATARELVPEVEGITDEDSISDWDPPFPFDRTRVRATPPHDQDDRYWKTYRATPKAFVSLPTARRLAGSRFGATTAWHLPADRAGDIDALAARLAAALDPSPLGLRIEPLRSAAVAAARGSTPFGSLFLALSGFLVIAGLLLEWLLFQLLVSARGRDLGVLSAVGWPPGRLAWLLVLVGAAAAVGGAVVGTLLGTVWAELLVTVLGRTWSTEVAGAPVAAFAAGRPRLAEVWPGGVAALVLSLLAMAWAARRAGRMPPLALMRQRTEAAPGERASGRLLPWAAGLALAGAAASAWSGRAAEWQTAVAVFFGSGLFSLAGLLLAVRWWLVSGGLAASRGPRRTLVGLARTGLAWRPGRAFSVAAIVAVAEFLIVAVSSFALRPPEDPADRSSPTGGWTWLARFAEPTAVDPTDPTTRAELGLPAAAADLLGRCAVARLRSSAGDDAACTNLYAPGRPIVLGLGTDFLRRGGFRFTRHREPADRSERAAVAANPWTLLDSPRPDGARVPAVLDQATAQWALGLGGLGAAFTIADEAGRDVELEIVGLLDTSILQGFVLVSDRDFQALFPGRSGYGMALVDASGVEPEQQTAVGPALAAAWADSGVAVETTVSRLRSLAAVQNTFLAGFQALGTLGLLLGTVGVAAVQMQSVLERRGQLALLRAVGFTSGRVRGLVVIETLLTVGLGLAVGTAAGLLAVTPLLADGWGPSGGPGPARLPLGWIAATAGLSLLCAVVAGLAAASRHAIPVRPSCE